MAHYTQISRNEISALFIPQIEEITEITPFSAGAENSTFKVVVDGSQFVLTVYEEKNRDEVLQIAHLIKYISDTGLPGSRIVQLKDGLVGTIQQKPAIIKSYIEGGILDKLNPQQCHQVGHSLAQLHSTDAPIYLPKQPNFGHSFMQAFKFNYHNIEFEDWLKKTTAMLSNHPDSALPKGLIHADIFADNLIFQNGNLVAIIDYEEACIFPLIYDLAMALVGCCRIDNKLSIDLANSLFEGYVKHRDLQLAEVEALPYFVIYAATSTAAWRYWKQTMSASGSETQFNFIEMKLFVEDFSSGRDQEVFAQLNIGN
jgi:homoserine kinase type II